MGSHAGRKPYTGLYFFYDDELVRVMRHRVRDGLTEVYNHDQKRYVTYETGDFRRKAQKGYILKEVAELIGRHPVVIHRNIANGNIPKPRMAKWKKESTRVSEGIYVFSEKDIWRTWDFFASNYRGPRVDESKYKKTNPAPGLTPRHDLTAALKEGTVYYVKLADGTFVPTWKAERF